MGKLCAAHTPVVRVCLAAPQLGWRSWFRDSTGDVQQGAHLVCIGALL